jgi:5,10-methenyltetrahydrofolate synthetase
MAEQTVPGTVFWAQNWRKGGLQERRNQLLKENQFYNQQYCGCEFSARNGALTKPLLRQQMRDAKHLHSAQLSAMSQHVVEQLAVRLADCQVLMGYWPLADEVDIRPLLNQLVRAGRTIVLPKVVDDEQMELRRYRSEDDLVEGAFHILEPAGEPFLEADQIEVALVPGMAFDAAGHRLGRGRGYYDRFLSAHPRLRKIGVCFPFQRVAEVPTADFDVSVDEVCG